MSLFAFVRIVTMLPGAQNVLHVAGVDRFTVDEKPCRTQLMQLVDQDIDTMRCCNTLSCGKHILAMMVPKLTLVRLCEKEKEQLTY